SSDPEFRRRAVAIDDYFVDVTWEGEIVRARWRDGKLLLHKGGDRYTELPTQEFGAGQISPTLGMELAARGHAVHFFSHAKPVRLDLSLPRIHFHQVEVGHATVFPCPDYTLPLAVKMAEVGRENVLELFHVHYAVPHATAAFLATEMIGAAAPKVVTTLHGTDTTLLGPNPQYRAAIEHALNHSDAVTTV